MIHDRESVATSPVKREAKAGGGSRNEGHGKGGNMDKLEECEVDLASSQHPR